MAVRVSCKAVGMLLSHPPRCFAPPSHEQPPAYGVGQALTIPTGDEPKNRIKQYQAKPISQP